MSTYYDRISNQSSKELNHDVTILNTRGKYSNIKQKTIMSVIPTKEYMLIKEVIKDIDNKAFVIVCDSYEVKGQDVSINDVNKTKK